MEASTRRRRGATIGLRCSVPASADHHAHSGGQASGWITLPWCRLAYFLIRRNDKKEWQAVANELPTGSVLLCSTRTNPRQRRILAQVSTHLQRKGRRVLTLSA